MKNRVHLDVRVGTGLVGAERLTAPEAECARLVALGAVRVRLLPADRDEESCLVMQNIEGNEFVSTEWPRTASACQRQTGRVHSGCFTSESRWYDAATLAA